MRIKKITDYTLIVFVLLLTACKKNVPAPADYASPSSFGQIFEDFWLRMNTGYVYWDIDTTDWDNMYKIYKPLFANLDSKNNKDIYTSLTYFRQMTAGLIDGHYSISFNQSPIAGTLIHPASDRKLTDPSFHIPFEYMQIDSGYLDKGYTTGSFITSAGQRMTALCGNIHGNIVYFHCDRFALQQAYEANNANPVKMALQYVFDKLKQGASVKGFVIDVRNNPGGDVNDLNFFIGHFINAPLPWGFTRAKSGSGRLAYTPWIRTEIKPQSDSAATPVHVVILADNYSVSLAEATAMAVHTMSKGVFVGETTWGATGPLTTEEVYNDGQFLVGDFLSVYTSSVEFRYIDGKSYESIGFPPDVHVPFDTVALHAGHDPALETALSVIGN